MVFLISGGVIKYVGCDWSMNHVADEIVLIYMATFLPSSWW